jgi:hypothetical protein
MSEDALDRVAADVVTQVAQGAPYARVTPAAVFARHPQHELDDVRRSTRSCASAAIAAIVLPGNESTVPAQQRNVSTILRQLVS